VSVDVARARAAVGDLAGRIGLSIEQTAEAIVQIAVSGMFSEVSGLVSRYGIDLRDFSVLAFGGAGPMLGCFLSRELGVRETVVPPAPGVLSALGGLIADLKNDFIKTVYMDLTPANAAAIAADYAGLEQRARAWLFQDQHYDGPATLLHSAELRYRGQSYELDTPLHAAAAGGGDAAPIAAAFHAEHQQVYGHSDPDAPIQIISLRVAIVGQTHMPSFPRASLVTGEATPSRMVDAWMDGAMRPTALHRRAALLPGQSLSGPAIVAQDDCTTIIPADFVCRVDAFGNLRITARPAAD
jgi:N-methylhydantoinase A